MKQAPGHQPQGQCGARPRGQTAGARPLPQPGGGAAPGTQPLPTPPRGAEPGTRGSLSLGLPSSRRGLASSPGRTAFAPGPPTQEQAARPGAGRRLPAPFHPQLAASTGSCVLFIPAPHHQELPTTSLPCFATPQTDRQETQRKKGEGGGKKNYRPSCCHPPAWSLEKRRKVSTSSLLLSIPTRRPRQMGQQGAPRWLRGKR